MMTMTEETAETQTGAYEIHCAEIWGGASVKHDDIATPGVRAAIHSSASGDEKGGDLYYFSVCAWDTLTRVAVADVRGHGAAVSQLSEWLYQSLEQRMNDSNGAAVLTDLNNIVRSKGFDAITTAVVATFDRDKSVLHYAYAGHPPVALSRAGQAWELLETPNSRGPQNLPLGILPNASYSQQQTKVSPGDRLFFYTDGVAECPGPGEALYGDVKMLQALNHMAGRSLPEMRRDLHEDLLAYAGGELTHDDCTFLFVEPLAAPSFWKRRWLPGKARNS